MLGLQQKLWHKRFTKFIYFWWRKDLKDYQPNTGGPYFWCMIGLKCINQKPLALIFGVWIYERIEVYQSKYNWPIFLVGPIHQAYWQNDNTCGLAQPLINKQGDIYYPVMSIFAHGLLSRWSSFWRDALTMLVGCLIVLISNEKLYQHGNFLLPYW